MNKKVIRILSVIAIILTIVMVASVSFAGEVDIKTIDGKGDVDVTDIGDVGNKIATILRAIGTVLLVVVLMVLGIKYMLGSAEEKAEYKKTMIPYLIGAILVFGATQIAGAVLNFSNS